MNTLAESSRTDGESIGKLVSLTLDGENIVTFSSREVNAVLKQLVHKQLVVQHILKRKPRWTITEEGLQTLQSARQLSEARLASVINTLFAGFRPIDAYRDALLQSLSMIFERLASKYVQESLVYDLPNSYVMPENIALVADNVLSNYSQVNRDVFISGLRRFFTDKSPDADWLKWAYCQNYYSLKIVGLGYDSKALSQEVFKYLTVYLDTNVLLSALDTNNAHHSSVVHLFERMHSLGCKLRVLEVTVHELGELARRMKDTFEDTLNQIPEKLLPKVSGIVPSTELRHRLDPTKPSPLSVLSDLENAENKIVYGLGFAIARDPFLKMDAPSESVQLTAKQLKAHYDNFQPYSRLKTEDAALHDAIALTYIDMQRSEGNFGIMLTLDKSLPTFRSLSDNNDLSHAITVDALFPWLGMVIGDDAAIVSSFAKLLATRVVSSGQSFSMDDFAMLAKMDLDCKNMPAEDVENCIYYLRSEAHGLDLRSAEDREQLHYKVQSFFASPDRKYLANVSDLRNQLREAKESLQRAQDDRNAAVERVRKMQIDEGLRFNKSRVRVKVILVVVLCVFGELAFLWVASRYCSGDNLLQRVMSCWVLFTLVIPLGLMLLRYLCRGDLWPIAKGVIWPFVGD